MRDRDLPFSARRARIAALACALISTALVARAAALEPLPGDVDSCDPEDDAAGKLLTLREFDGLQGIALRGDRLMIREEARWTLWDRPSGRALAQGKTKRGGLLQFRPDMAGDVVMTGVDDDAIGLLDARDGALIRTLPLRVTLSTRAGLSADGRYVYALAQGVLRAWDIAGVQRAEHRTEVVFAEHIHAGDALLRVAPRDRPHIETIALATGEAQVSTRAYAGVFHRWFLDGSHFVTFVAGTQPGVGTLHVYASDATLLQSLPWRDASQYGAAYAGGDGEHFWIEAQESASAPRQVRVFRLGSPDAVLTFAGAWVLPAGRTAMSPFTLESGRLGLLDLRGSQPTLHAHDVPDHISRASADADGSWSIVDHGIIFDGARLDARGWPRTLGCPVSAHVKGSADTLAVATDDHVVRVYNTATGTLRLTQKLEGVDARLFALSADGRTLVVGTGALVAHQLDALGRRVGSTVLRTADQPPLTALSISADGTRVAATTCGEAAKEWCQHLLFERGRLTPFEVTVPVRSKALISPSGTRLAMMDATLGPPFPGSGPDAILPVAQEFTSIYDGETVLARAHDVRPVAWVDDDHLLIAPPLGRFPAVLDVTTSAKITMSEPLIGTTGSAGPGRFHDRERVFGADASLLWRLPPEAGFRPVVNDQTTTVVGDHFVFTESTSVRFVRMGLSPGAK